MPESQTVNNTGREPIALCADFPTLQLHLHTVELGKTANRGIIQYDVQLLPTLSMLCAVTFESDLNLTVQNIHESSVQCPRSIKTKDCSASSISMLQCFYKQCAFSRNALQFPIVEIQENR